MRVIRFNLPRRKIICVRLEPYLTKIYGYTWNVYVNGYSLSIKGRITKSKIKHVTKFAFYPPF